MNLQNQLDLEYLTSQLSSDVKLKLLCQSFVFLDSPSSDALINLNIDGKLDPVTISQAIHDSNLIKYDRLKLELSLVIDLLVTLEDLIYIYQFSAIELNYMSCKLVKLSFDRPDKHYISIDLNEFRKLLVAKIGSNQRFKNNICYGLGLLLSSLITYRLI